MAVARFLKSFRFTVELTGDIAFTMGFQEVTGFDATYDVIEYRSGEDNILTPAKFTGLIKYSNVTLTRGMASSANSQDFWNWISLRGNGLAGQQGTGATAYLSESAESGSGAKMTINLLSDEGTPAATWELADVLPVKYTGPDLKANASELAIEKLEVAHRGLARVS